MSEEPEVYYIQPERKGHPQTGCPRCGAPMSLLDTEFAYACLACKVAVYPYAQYTCPMCFDCLGSLAGHVAPDVDLAAGTDHLCLETALFTVEHWLCDLRDSPMCAPGASGVPVPVHPNVCPGELPAPRTYLLPGGPLLLLPEDRRHAVLAADGRRLLCVVRQWVETYRDKLAQQPFDPEPGALRHAAGIYAPADALTGLPSRANRVYRAQAFLVEAHRVLREIRSAAGRDAYLHRPLRFLFRDFAYRELANRARNHVDLATLCDESNIVSWFVEYLDAEIASYLHENPHALGDPHGLSLRERQELRQWWAENKDAPAGALTAKPAYAAMLTTFCFGDGDVWHLPSVPGGAPLDRVMRAIAATANQHRDFWRRLGGNLTPATWLRPRPDLKGRPPESDFDRSRDVRDVAEGRISRDEGLAREHARCGSPTQVAFRPYRKAFLNAVSRLQRKAR